jgi:hypothetical protein
VIGRLRANRLTLLLVASLALAGGTGYLTASAVGVGKQEPTRTVTIDVATGPQGPPGPPGSPGAESCPDGYSFGSVVFNTPGGHQQIATCLKD